MGLIDRAANAAEIELERDVPLPHQRRARDWARLIGLARKLESKDDEVAAAAHERAERLADQNTQLQSALYAAEKKIANLEFREKQRAAKQDMAGKMSSMELSPEAQQKLLGSLTLLNPVRE